MKREDVIKLYVWNLHESQSKLILGLRFMYTSDDDKAEYEFIDWLTDVSYKFTIGSTVWY